MRTASMSAGARARRAPAAAAGAPRARLGMSRLASPAGAGRAGSRGAALAQGASVRKGRRGRGARVEVRAAGVEGYWNVVCGAWADAIGVIRTGVSNGVARLGGLVIECNKKRGKGCTVRAPFLEEQRPSARPTAARDGNLSSLLSRARPPLVASPPARLVAESDALPAAATDLPRTSPDDLSHEYRKRGARSARARAPPASACGSGRARAN